ncbi:hypothetical protein [Natronoglycomyces albus]|uniref:Helix-hairpin-helix domain-containing protein n=1 Tax=Natronoglycomyces albus TaxID=2811108 RepID=A0A895XHW4_9ACTN|nr:hypothetical protein [Natronoglycomyces albus]QSB04924.1 hypothetical protein JQS30_14330 [Natronoglycomyces albus]
MTTKAHLRKSALSNPEVVEGSHNGTPIFTIAGTEFVSLDSDSSVRLSLRRAEAEELIAQFPTAQWDGNVALLPIADIDGQALNYWIRRAWFTCAPDELAARASAADEATPGTVGDLPKAIGRPATQALANAGITTLEQVARLTDAQLKALHGVGPKAVRILRESIDGH